MDLDNTFKLIGSFHKFQKCMIVLLGSSSLFCAMILYSTIFTEATPKLICNYINSNYTNKTIQSDCDVWLNISKSKNNDEPIIYKCEYDQTYYGDTVTTDLNLICDREYLIKLSQTFFMVGCFSVLFSGYFGDKFGRFRFIMILLVSTLIVNAVGQLMQMKMVDLSIDARYYVYTLTQFLLGALSFSIYITGYVLLLELTSKDNHTIFSIINLYFYVLGEVVVVGIAYFVNNWRIFNWILVIYNFFLTIVAALFLVESPSWLIESKQYDRAIKSLNKIALINGRKDVFNVDRKINNAEEFYQYLVEKGTIDERDSNSGIEYKEGKQILINDDTDSVEKNNSKSMLKSIFIGKDNIIKTVLLSYIWIAVSLLYFGVSFGYYVY